MTGDWGFQRRMIEEFDGRGAWEQMPEMTETEFLKARISEDERTAGAASDANLWRWSQQGRMVIDDAGHMQRFTPARMLAECAAKREVIATYEGAVREAERLSGSSLSSLLRWTVSGLRDAVHILATVYRDHPDWDPDWDGERP